MGELKYKKNNQWTTLNSSDIPVDGLEQTSVTNALVQRDRTYNYLDNSDFRNPVNQRLKESYTSGYGIDRWCIVAADTKMEVLPGYLKVTGGGIWQKLLNINTSAPYTLVAQDTTGALHVANGTFESGASSPSQLIGFSTSALGTPAVMVGAGSWIWVALYPGTYLSDGIPPYIPKGYATEQAECRRYYCFIEPTYWEKGEYIYGDGIRVTLAGANNMRLSPTPELSSPKIFTGNGWFDLTFSGSRTNQLGVQLIFHSTTPESYIEAGKAYLVLGIKALNADL